MTFLAPWALAVGAAAALGAIVLHLIAWRRPPTAPFPTARFIPDGEVRAASWSRRPADLPLLLVRVLALLLAAAAFARPVRSPARAADVRVFVVDRSRAVEGAHAAHDSVMTRYRTGDRVIAFDSTAVAADTNLAALAPRDARGSLSAGLAAALGTVRDAARGADRLTLVMVSPLAREEIDSATAALRARWPGEVRFVALSRTAMDSAPVAATLLDARPDDALAAALSLAAQAGRAGGARPVRVSRGDSLRAADLAAARDGAVVVWWPVVPNDGTKEGAVSGASAVVVASLARPAGPAPAGAPVARWLSGATAAAERRVGRGCVREVRVPVPQAGDLVLSPSFVALVRELLAPCGGERDFAAADMRVLAAPPVATAFDRETERRSPLAPWLLGAALALLLAEPLLRRSAARRADADDAASGGADDVGAAA